MAKPCQHCGDNQKAVQKEGHKFCINCGRVKRGHSKATISVKNYDHHHWHKTLGEELSGGRVFFGEVADVPV